MVEIQVEPTVTSVAALPGGNRCPSSRHRFAAPCGVGLISSYSTGLGAVMAIGAHVRAGVEFVNGGLRFHSAATVPPGVGLKTSSAFTTAAMRSAASASGMQLSPQQLVELSAILQKAWGMTTAGSVDDTWSAVAGGIVVADAASKTLIARFEPPEDLRICVLIPDLSVPPAAHRMDRQRASHPYRKEFSQLLDRLIGGEFVQAATEAAFLQSHAFGYDTRPLTLALRAGARGVALSGKGPSRAAFCGHDTIDEVSAVWRHMYPTARVFSVHADNLGVVSTEGNRLR